MLRYDQFLGISGYVPDGGSLAVRQGRCDAFAVSSHFALDETPYIAASGAVDAPTAAKSSGNRTAAPGIVDHGPGAEDTAMPTLAQRHLEQQIAELDQQITHLKLRVGQQVIHVNELVGHPQEAKKGRAALDRWLGELSLLQRHRLNLYQQLARFIQCAPRARSTSGGRFHPESCRLIW